ncbi:hypothetical protein PS6_011564 [Mucor atramentarius]
MLLHLADQNLQSFGSGPSSRNFVYESRNKSLKAINTSGKTNLELTLLKRQLITARLEDYVNTLPPVALAPHSADDADFLPCIRNKDNDNVLQMSESVQDEYRVSSECFDLQQFLSKRLRFTVCGYEHLPPSAVKSLRFKKYSALTTDDFLLLLQYYTLVYSNAQYILGIENETTSMKQDLVNEGYLKAENKVLKFVSLSLFHSKYKSCEHVLLRHKSNTSFGI